MASIEIKTRVSVTQLLEAVAQLAPDELELFAQRVNELRQRHQDQTTGSEPLDVLNEDLPEAITRRYEHLLEKLQREALDEEEHRKLVGLTDKLETHHSRRLEAMAQLARTRHQTLNEVMAEFQPSPSDG